MPPATVGYEYLRQSLNLTVTAFAPQRIAKVRSSVTRVTRLADELAIPRGVAPRSDDPLTHLLFALKHEGTNLSLLSQIVPRIEPNHLVAELCRIPNSGYLRQIALLWEQWTRRSLDGVPETGGAYVDLFDPARYVTGPTTGFSRWRVNWNGLGSLAYCATVERSQAVLDGLKSDILTRVREFSDGLADGLLQRTQEWAYLHETQSSFAIERETPNESKARAFMHLLERAHDRADLSEDYLAELQAATVRNPLDQAVAFRSEQNWLRGPGRGALGVTYIPPPPQLARGLMAHLMAFANGPAQTVPPLVAASVISFGFVFLHPFMDGNGRLSRFLFHHALCQSGQLPPGNLLPVSVAMQQNEAAYLSALRGYSAQARQRWDVRWIDDERFDLHFNATDDIYRFWDATVCAEFGFRMAELALENGLKREARFLDRFDEIRRRIENEFDVRSSDLSPLIVMCLDNNGVVSKHRRKQYLDRVPAALFDSLETIAGEVMAQSNK